MKTSRVLDSFIIPFRHSGMFLNSKELERDFEKLIKKLTDQFLWTKTELNFNSNLFTHVTNIVDNNFADRENEEDTKGVNRDTIKELDKMSKSSICTYLTLGKDPKVRKQYGLSTKGYSLMNGEKSVSSFSFDDIGMFLFKSGIGFVVIDIKFDGKVELQDVVETNFHIKRLMNRKVVLKSIYRQYRIDGKKVSLVDQEPSDAIEQQKTVHEVDGSWLIMDIPDPNLKAMSFDILIENKTDKKGNEVQYATLYDGRISMADVIINLLEGIESSEYFGAVKTREEKSSRPVHCLPYSVVVGDHGERWKDGLGKSLYHLRHGFNDSHKPTLLNQSLDNKEVEKVFDNSAWGVSKEGCANIVVPDDDDRKFFEGSYQGSVKKEYRFLYLLALHQYFGLVGFANELSVLPSDTRNYNKEDMERLETLSMRMGFFYLKAIFNEVSFMSHQQEVYERMIDVLAINDLLDELKHESDNVLRIIQAHHGEVQETRVKRFSWIGSIFAVLAIVQSIWELVDSYFSAKAFNEVFVLTSPNADFYMVMLLLVGVTGLVVMSVVGLKTVIEKIIVDKR